MTMHDESNDAHVKSLRLALGSILAPKRVSSTRSSAATSGTASPLHPATFGNPLPAAPNELHSTPHDRHNPRASRAPLMRAQTESNVPSLSRPHIPSPLGSSDASPEMRSASLPNSSSMSSTHVDGIDTPSRADFIKTLQSKNRFDALIHGSFV
ncbi:hypothetical protein QCA50_016087 [Cerrena zonata]|uniref:Uncharacterized protein n=1 Tax=Cerrena zonata TaxID=2478898 RepID=A0AAW0FP34_9APHY